MPPQLLLPMNARTSSSSSGLEALSVGQSQSDDFGGGSREESGDRYQYTVRNTFIDIEAADTIHLHRMGAKTCQARFSVPKADFFMDVSEEIEGTQEQDATAAPEPPSQSLESSTPLRAEARDTCNFGKASHGPLCLQESSPSCTSFPVYSGCSPHVSSPRASGPCHVDDLPIAHYEMQGQRHGDPAEDRANHSMPKCVFVSPHAPTAPALYLKPFAHPALAPACAPASAFQQLRHCPSTLSPYVATHSALEGGIPDSNMAPEWLRGIAGPSTMFIDTHFDSGHLSTTANLPDVHSISPCALGAQKKQPNPLQMSSFSSSSSSVQRQQPLTVPVVSSSPFPSRLTPGTQTEDPVPMAPGYLGESPKSFDSQASPTSHLSAALGRGKSLRKMPAFPGGSCASVGSKSHGILTSDGQPACRPCAWFYKESGCLKASSCRFCHLCPRGDLKQRKKNKVAWIRSQEAADAAAKMSSGTIGEQMPPGLLPSAGRVSAVAPVSAGTDCLIMQCEE
eukprot:TRINITY_DN27151_c0_g1_i1.p1 TRINITY_DN27151_c0_g1~~TRINITY_DN27151_c0_g1_i1.p1  ORF type:complete len:509 (-),score=51.75 TRINITY_DN27151_c0_g1_i1:115-1641(-)